MNIARVVYIVPELPGVPEPELPVGCIRKMPALPVAGVVYVQLRIESVTEIPGRYRLDPDAMPLEWSGPTRRMLSPES